MNWKVISMQKKSQEDYLEAILIQINKVGACRVTDIARQIGFTKASTSVALKKLEEDGLVIRDDWRVLLTDKGYTTAKSTYEKHLFFVEWLDKLGIEKRVAEEEACGIEHIISDDTYKKIKKFVEGRV